jgi:hypothetical protein
MVQTPNKVDRQVINTISSCLLRISEYAQSELKIKFTNKVSLSNDIRVIEGAVIDEPESV